MKIAFVTDSGIGKTAAEMAADGIISLPLQISVDGRSLQDMEDIDKDQPVSYTHLAFPGRFRRIRLAVFQQIDFDPAAALRECSFTRVKDRGFQLQRIQSVRV